MSESNNNTPMRITQLEEATSYPEGAYLPIAKAGYGTKKILASMPSPFEKKTFSFDETYFIANLETEKNVYYDKYGVKHDLNGVNAVKIPTTLGNTVYIHTSNGQIGILTDSEGNFLEGFSKATTSFEDITIQVSKEKAAFLIFNITVNQQYSFSIEQIGVAPDYNVINDINNVKQNYYNENSKFPISSTEETVSVPNQGYIQLSGNIIVQTGSVQWIYSDLTPCTEGEKITYSAYGQTTVATIIFFDEIGSVVSYIAYVPTGSETIGKLSGTVTVPEGAKSFRCCTYYPNLTAYFFKYLANDNLVDTLEYLDNKTAGSTSPWKNKTIDCLGDSITYGAGLANPAAERWSTILSELTGATCNNYGVSGSKVSEISGDQIQSFVERYSSMDDADLVIIFGGTNDYWHQATEIGTLGNLDTSTFIGALSTIFVNLVAKSPITQVVFVFPYQQYYSGSSTRADKGHGTFKAFRDAAKSVCEFYSVPMLDLFSDSGFDVIDSEVQRTALTSDGLHANKYGQIYLAKRIKAFIENINCIL